MLPVSGPPRDKLVDIPLSSNLWFHNDLILKLLWNDFKGSIETFLRTLHKVRSILIEKYLPIFKVFLNVLALRRTAIVVQKLAASHPHKGGSALKFSEEVSMQLETISFFTTTPSLSPLIEIIMEIFDDEIL